MMYRSVSGLLASAVFLVSVHGSAWSIDRYVPTQLYPTVQSAINAASPYDRILLMSTMNGPGFTMNKPGITIQPANPSDFIPINLSSATYPIDVTSDNCRLERLVITCPAAGRCVKLGAEIHSFKMYYCYLYGPYSGGAYYGIDDYGSDQSTYDDCLFYYQNRGIDAFETTAMKVFSCTFENPVYNINFYGYSDYIVYNLLAQNNYFSISSGGLASIRSSFPTAVNGLGLLSSGANTYNVVSGYPLKFEYRNRVNLTNDYFLWCPSLAWTSIGGPFSLTESGCTYYYCRHP